MRETDLFIYENAAVNRWVYPHVKALEENVIGNSAARSVIIRFFNTYGPDMDFPAPKRVVPHFIDNVLHSRPLLLSGSGEQVRTFCYVDDMVIGLCLALDFAAGQKAPFNECFNLGGGIPISMRDLANQFADLAHKVGLTNQRLPRFDEAGAGDGAVLGQLPRQPSTLPRRSRHSIFPSVRPIRSSPLGKGIWLPRPEPTSRRL